MKIRGWHIDGFGHFHDQRETDLPPGLTVFLGPNEAGKSTLLAYLRGMLFGFPSGRQAESRYEPLYTRHMGGKLFIDTPQGPYVIQRNGDRKEGFKLYRPDDSEGGESELAQLLGHADQGLFKSIFAFSLTELQNLNVHKEEGIRDRIFAGGLQGGRNTAREALTLLGNQNAPIFKPRGREVELVKLSRQLDELQDLIVAAKKQSQNYEDLVKQEETLGESIKQFTQDQAALLRQIQRYQTLLDLWPKWLERSSLQRALEDTEPVDAFPDQAESRHAEAVSIIKGLEAVITELQLEHTECRQRLSDISLDDKWPVLSERISRVAADGPRFLDWSQSLADNAQKRSHAQSEFDAALATLGMSWSRERLESFDTSIPQADEVSRWETQLEHAEQTVAEAARDVKTAQQQAEISRLAVEDHRRRITQLGDVIPLEVIAKQEECLVRLRTNTTDHKELLSEQRQLEETLRTLEIEYQRAPGGEASALPKAVRLGLWGVAALLIALALWKGLTQDVATAVSLVVLAAVLIWVSFLKVRPAGNEQKARKLIENEIRQAKAKQDEIKTHLDALAAKLREDGSVLGLSEKPSTAEIEAFAQRLSQARDQAKTHKTLLQDLERLQAQEADAHSQQERARQAQEAAQKAFATLEASWKQWRQAAGVEEDRTPKGVAALFQTITSARQLLMSLKALEANTELVAVKVARYREEAIALLTEAGEAVPSSDTQLAHAVTRLQDALATDLEARNQHATLSRELKTLELKLEAKRQELQQAQGVLEALYSEAGAHDEASFSHRLGVYGSRQVLKRSIRELDRFLEEHLGRDAKADELKGLLQSEQVESWRVAIAEAEITLEEIARQRDEANQTLGKLRDECRKLEEASDVISREHEYQALLDEFRRQARNWLVRSLAEDMIQETLKEVERTRQPAVLGHASQLFSQVTEGRYLRLAHQEGGEFHVIDQRDNRRGVDKLSRGTAEQLYLCLRLGLIREFARQSANLPLIMDDVFVNFDPERARRVAELLIDFSTEHQVLLFTCHPQTAEMLQEIQPDLRVVTMPRFGGHSPDLIERTIAPTVSYGDSGRDPREVILECLQTAEQALGKNEILKRTGLPDNAWGQAIASLKAEGAIEQQGEKKGAVYRVALAASQMQ